LSRNVQNYFRDTYKRETHFIPNGVNIPKIMEAQIISNKIAILQQKQASDRIRNNIPTNIILIAKNLASGNIDTNNANSIINAEAKKRVESRPKTKFSLTEEQEKKQVLSQIRIAMLENADKIDIQNPEKTILQMQKLKLLTPFCK